MGRDRPQGGVDEALRRQSVERTLEIGFPGYAIGGLTVGEDRQAMLDTTELVTGMLPRDRIRYGRYAKLQEFVVEALADNAVAAE